MSLATDLLTSIQSSISLGRSGGPQIKPGDVIHWLVNAPDLSNLQIPIVGNGDFSLTWLVKNVRFNDALPVPLGMDNATPPQPLSLADSLMNYLSGTNNILGGAPITGVQTLLPGPSLTGAIPPTSEIGVGISTIAGSVVPPTTNVTPSRLTDAPPPIPGLPTLAPNTASAKDLLSGIPGLIGQIGGSIPMLMSVPVSLNVSWKVQVEQFRPTKEPLPPHYIDLTEGKDFLAPNGLTGTAIDLVFAPVFAELGKETTSTIYVCASVTLSAGNISLPPLILRLPITLPQIGIPSVAAMFKHTNFRPQDDGNAGFVFVMVPNSLAGIYPNYAQLVSQAAQVTQSLLALRNALAPLNTFLHVVGFLTGLGTLIDALTAIPQVGVQFLAADKVSNLDDIHFGDGDKAGNAISSMILLGVPGTNFELYNHVNYNVGNSDQASLTLQTGDSLWAALTNFTFGTTEQAAQYALPTADVVTVINGRPSGDSHNDSATSVCFNHTGTGNPAT